MDPERGLASRSVDATTLRTTASGRGNLRGRVNWWGGGSSGVAGCGRRAPLGVSAHQRDDVRMRCAGSKRRAGTDRSAKLTDYLLSPARPVGRFKARFFNRVGFRADTWEVLEQALREQHVLVADAEAGEPEAFGQPFTIRAILRGPNGVAARVVSVWFVRSGEDVPQS
jgi:hypothetical protein